MLIAEQVPGATDRSGLGGSGYEDVLPGGAHFTGSRVLCRLDEIVQQKEVNDVADAGACASPTRIGLILEQSWKK